MKHRGRFTSSRRVVQVAGLQVVLSLLWLAAATQAQALEVYDIDAVHSAANFKVRHIFAYTSGHFTQFGGTLWYDAQKPENSRIEIAIQAASINTGNDQRDNHLRSADFFDVEKFPQITFKSTKIVPAKDPQHYRVTGDFTLHGVTKPVTIDVEVLGFGENPGLGKRGGFSAQVTLDRTAFGIVWNKTLESGGLLLGNEVQVDFPLEVVLHTEKP
jgi:polyisoprenoid-binding protein YceI